MTSSYRPSRLAWSEYDRIETRRPCARGASRRYRRAVRQDLRRIFYWVFVGMLLAITLLVLTGWRDDRLMDSITKLQKSCDAAGGDFVATGVQYECRGARR